MDLAAIFNELNHKHFDGFLEAPKLAWNSRLRKSAGRFIPARRKWFKKFPPTIEVASYLLGKPNPEKLVTDTMAHEMIHYWLWVRGQPYGHTPEFYKKLKIVGAPRYNLNPK